MSAREKLRAAPFILAVFFCACTPSSEPSGGGVDAAIPPADVTPKPSAAPPPAGSTGDGKNTPPAPSASASSAESLDLKGTWEGSYDAKKGAVELPANVKDKVRQKDDGKSAVGPGTLVVTVSDTGEVKGGLDGALGKATLSGKAEGNMVRASVFPDDPTAADAMTGIFVAAFKDGTLRGEIRVAGPDAMIVRESPVELKKK